MGDPARSNTQAMSVTSPWTALGALCVGLFMIIVDGTIVNVAIPAIIHGLSASLNDIIWANSSYLLTFAVPLVVSGRLGDRYGPRRVFLAGQVIFTLASAVCGLATTPMMLIMARAVQGLGAAAMAPQTMAFVTRLFPPNRRGVPMGIWGTVVGIASIAGPVLGGFLVEALSWQWVFFVNVPVGVAGVVLTLTLVPDWQPRHSHHFDPLGIGLCCAGLLAVVLGLQEGQRYDWGTVAGPVTILRLIAAGVLILVAFVVWQRLNRTEPLLPLRIFGYRNFSLSGVANIAVGFTTAGMFLPLIIYIQSVLGYSAISSGLITTPMALVSGIIAPFAGRLSDRISGRWIAAFGFCMLGLGIAMLAAGASSEASGTTMLLPFGICGIGVACIFSPLANLATHGLDPRLIGAGSGIFATARQGGGVIGSAAIGALLQSRLAVELPAHARASAMVLPPAYRRGFIAGVTRSGGSGFSANAVPLGTPAGIARQIRGLGGHAFDAAFTDAMKVTLILPIAVLAVGVLACLAMRRPAIGDTGAPAAAEASRPDSAGVTG